MNPWKWDGGESTHHFFVDGSGDRNGTKAGWGGRRVGAAMGLEEKMQTKTNFGVVESCVMLQTLGTQEQKHTHQQHWRDVSNGQHVQDPGLLERLTSCSDPL